MSCAACPHTRRLAASTLIGSSSHRRASNTSRAMSSSWRLPPCRGRPRGAPGHDGPEPPAVRDGCRVPRRPPPLHQPQRLPEPPPCRRVRTARATWTRAATILTAGVRGPPPRWRRRSPTVRRGARTRCSARRSRGTSLGHGQNRPWCSGPSVASSAASAGVSWPLVGPPCGVGERPLHVPEQAPAGCPRASAALRPPGWRGRAGRRGRTCRCHRPASPRTSRRTA